MRRRGWRSWKAAIAAPIFVVVGVFYAFPLYWLVATSLKSNAELYQATLTLFPQTPTFEPYVNVFVDRGFWVLIGYSEVVWTLIVMVALIFGLLLHYPSGVTG